MSTALPVFALCVTVVAGFFLIKRFKPVIVLFFAGVILVATTIVARPGLAVLDEETTSGSAWFDIFGLVERIAGSQLTGVGLIIMAAGGFSTYVNKIGATRALVRVVSQPIARLRRPYLVMVLAYVIGQLLFMVIPSAAGLAVLLLVLMLPILVNAGISPAAGAAVIATTSALPMGPAAGTAVLAAETIGISPAVYFVQNQLPVAIPTIGAIAVTHYFVQRYHDAKNRETYETPTASARPSDREAPGAYAIFLLLPIALLIVFSPLVNHSIELTTVSAFLMVWLLAVVVELIRTHDRRRVLADANDFFTGMGAMFGSVVALIIAAQLFAEGLKIAGLIDFLLTGAQSLGVGMALMAIVFTLIVGLVTFLTGSGVGAFSAFASLAPDVAGGLGGSVTTLVTPMQFAAGLFRSMSPISGVVIAVAGGVGISPIVVVRRTLLPMIVGILVMTLCSFLLG